jgi:SAM-dependent methyltransferase
MNNPIFELLCSLGVCDSQKAVKIQDFVRDRNDIQVHQCLKSKAIFLENVEHIDITHYDKKAPTHKQGVSNRQVITTSDDTQRRFNAFKNIIRNKSWLDIVTGSGAVLDLLSPLAKNYAAVEPQEKASEFLTEMGHTVYRRLDDVPPASYDITTLFHVFEHLPNPKEVLLQIYELMNKDGKLVIEVPHAKDFLITQSQPFREHTFWSEHLFLHTRETLTALLEDSGYQVTAISSVQRYSLANHLYWLAKGKPAGHVEWSHLSEDMLNSHYESVLAKNDMTDTLIVYANK